jgi:hypothetical protein
MNINNKQNHSNQPDNPNDELDKRIKLLANFIIDRYLENKKIISLITEEFRDNIKIEDTFTYVQQ